MDDFDLLREYAEQQSDAAFEELVRRHVNLVYSAALRMTGEAQAAQDIAQTVFIQLARKADSLSKPIILGGWLYRTTQNVSETYLRGERRRRRREEIAMEMADMKSDSVSTWREVAPFLDQAMRQLKKADQDAVVMRFFEGQSLRELGTALGVGEDAAQKRVERALDKLRRHLSTQGVTVSAAMLALLLAGQAVQAAPAGVAATLAGGALAGGAKAGAAGLMTSTLKLFAASKLNGGLAVTMGLLLLAGGAAAVFNQGPAEAPQANPGQLTDAAIVLRGKVVTQEGQPVNGALVRVATPQVNVSLYQTTNLNTGSNPAQRRAAPSALTGPDGSFAVRVEPSPEGKMVMVATADAGYGIVTSSEFDFTPEIKLAPWGRIEGELRIGKTPGTNQTLNLGIWGSEPLYEYNLIWHGTSVKTDENGRFVFPRVAPIDYWISRNVFVLPGSSRQHGHHYLRITPGQTNKVQLGGKGYQLTGKVICEGSERLIFRGSMWPKQNHAMRPPRNWRQMSDDEKREHERAWRESEQGKLFKAEVRNYEFPVAADGSFKVQDILPGIYRLQVRADSRAQGKVRGPSAIGETQLDLPDIPDDLVDEPFDIGVIEAQMQR